MLETQKMAGPFPSYDIVFVPPSFLLYPTQLIPVKEEWVWPKPHQSIPFLWTQWLVKGRAHNSSWTDENTPQDFLRLRLAGMTVFPPGIMGLLGFRDGWMKFRDGSYSHGPSTCRESIREKCRNKRWKEIKSNPKSSDCFLVPRSCHS